MIHFFFLIIIILIVLRDKQKVHCWEFIPKALFIYLPEVQFLYSVEHHVLLNVLFIDQGLEWALVF